MNHFPSRRHYDAKSQQRMPIRKHIRSQILAYIPDRLTVPALFPDHPIHLSFLCPLTREQDGTTTRPFSVGRMRDHNPILGIGSAVAPHKSNYKEVWEYLLYLKEGHG